MTNKSQKKEIFWNIINSVLAGGIALVSSVLTILATEDITFEGFCVAFGIGFFTSLGIALVKFKDYWAGEQGEYSNKIFNFIK